MITAENLKIVNSHFLLKLWSTKHGLVLLVWYRNWWLLQRSNTTSLSSFQICQQLGFHTLNDNTHNLNGLNTPIFIHTSGNNKNDCPDMVVKFHNQQHCLTSSTWQHRGYLIDSWTKQDWCRAGQGLHENKASTTFLPTQGLWTVTWSDDQTLIP